MKRISLIITFSIIILFIFIMYLALFSKNGGFSVTPLIGKKAPEFNLKTFNNTEIDSLTIKDKSVVLNFWASWCVPCVEEVEVLDRANSRFENEDVLFIGVNIWDDYDNAVNFINRYNADYLNVFDTVNEIQVNYGIQGVPETYFIDKNGIIVNRFQGPLTDSIVDYFVNQTISDNNEK